MKKGLSAPIKQEASQGGRVMRQNREAESLNKGNSKNKTPGKGRVMKPSDTKRYGY